MIDGALTLPLRHAPTEADAPQLQDEPPDMLRSLPQSTMNFYVIRRFLLLSLGSEWPICLVTCVFLTSSWTSTPARHT